MKITKANGKIEYQLIETLKKRNQETDNKIVKRVSSTFKDEQYLRRVSGSRQRWVDDDIHEIAGGIISYLKKL